jgi:hypothetical protein
LSAPDFLGGGQFRFTITSSPGAIFQVQMTTNFAGWNALGSVTNTSGTMIYTDGSAGRNHAFYRLLQQ